jgi:hypothetical protein
MLNSEQRDEEESLLFYNKSLSLYTSWHDSKSGRVGEVLVKLSDHHFRVKAYDAGM